MERQRDRAGWTEPLLWVVIVATAVVGAIGVNWLATSGERNLEHNLKSAGYVIEGSFVGGMHVNYVFTVGDCTFRAAPAGGFSDEMRVYRLKDYSSSSALGIVDTSTIKTVGKAITGYTPFDFATSEQYKKCEPMPE